MQCQSLAESYHQSGIPFWLIRPFEEVARMHVDELCSPQSPLGQMSLVLARRSHALFEGKVDDLEKFVSIWRIYRVCSIFSTPYTNTILPNLKAMLIRESAEEPKRMKSCKQFVCYCALD